MKLLFWTIAILFLLLSCQQASNTEIVEGDLYFKAIDFRMYSLPGSILSKIENQAKTADIDTLCEQEKKFHKHISFLVEKGLFRKPYIRIKNSEGAMMMVFLDPSDFKEVEKYELPSLRERNKKVRIKVKATQLDFFDFTAYNSTELISVEEMDGVTESEK